MKTAISFALLLALLAPFGAQAQNRYVQGDHTVDPRRGNPGEYDPGPAAGSEWARLFGETPNYRALGQAILGGGAEKFRWQFGPMWYRGRLGKNEVKVFVVGQEGAQDENVSNRAFTGSTGTKTQKFLNHLGINISYLFLNTFVYTINGQLEDDPRFQWMEQDPKSPIVEYRHRLFDYMLEQNSDSLALIIGVGSGGKASVATWINERGGNCSTRNEMAECDTSGMNRWFASQYRRDGVRVPVNIANRILVVGVPHPGGASPNNGGAAALENIVRGFTNAARRVAQFMRSEGRGDWLTPDIGSRAEVMARMETPYRYGNAPVPFQDFAFGTNWRMGETGTTSNRQGADSIQIFSKNGKYNNDGDNLKYADRSRTYEGKRTDLVERGGRIVAVEGMADVDLAYESPKWDAANPEHVLAYDPGPCGSAGTADNVVYSCPLSRLLQTWPNLWSGSVKPINDPSLGHGPSYRGRLDDAKVLVIADQFDHDDIFSTRALTGATGQRLQTFLKVAGAGKSYAILRTLPVDTIGLDNREVLEIAGRADVVRTRNAILAEILKKNRTKAIVVLGAVAQELARTGRMDLPRGVEVVELAEPREDSHIAAWDSRAGIVAQAISARKQGSYDGRLSAIARIDLPVHTRWWMGSSASRASRAERVGVSGGDKNGDYYRVWAPNWVTRLSPRNLNKETIDYLAQVVPERGRSVLEDRRWDLEDDSWEFYAAFWEGVDFNDLGLSDIEMLLDRLAMGRSGGSSSSIPFLAPGATAGIVELETREEY